MRLNELYVKRILEEYYRTYGREWHSDKHVLCLLQGLEEYRDILSAGMQRILEAAILFHDCKYCIVDKSKDWEALSAETAEVELERIGWDARDIRMVKILILSTKPDARLEGMNIDGLGAVAVLDLALMADILHDMDWMQFRSKTSLEAYEEALFNEAIIQGCGITRFIEGQKAFYRWLKENVLSGNKIFRMERNEAYNRGMADRLEERIMDIGEKLPKPPIEGANKQDTTEEPQEIPVINESSPAPVCIGSDE